MPHFKNYVHLFILSISLLFFSNAAIADKVLVGDWILDVQGNSTEAFTGNDSGSTFGFLCYGESCVFYLDTKTKCDQGAQYPMLINSDSGATFVNTNCAQFTLKEGIRYVMSIRDKDVVTTISKGNAIGFAIPMIGGQFKVVRFSLNGALDATGKAVASFNNLKERPVSQTFRDTTM